VIVILPITAVQLLPSLTYLAAAAAIACFAAVPFLGLQSPGTAAVASVNEALGR